MAGSVCSLGTVDLMVVGPLPDGEQKPEQMLRWRMSPPGGRKYFF